MPFEMTRRHRHCLLLLLLLALGNTALGLHGFSISEWHNTIDHSGKAELLFGRSRPIRSDDWQVLLASQLGQRTHDPAFPVVNTNIGGGQNMLTMVCMPTRSVVTLFRPCSWGFFLGADTGLAWQWSLRVFGLLAALFLLFSALAPGAVTVAALCSLLLLYAPFLQVWSLNDADVITDMALCAVLTLAALAARTRRAALLLGLGLGWAGGCFLQTMYPAYQVPLAYLFLALVAGVYAERRRELRPQPALVLLSVAAALAVFGTCAWGFYAGVRDVLPVVMNTEYPGRRMSLGGDFPGRALFSNYFLHFPAIRDWGRMANECEASGFLYTFPLTIGAYAAAWLRARTPPGGAALALAGYLACQLVYIFVGLPPLIGGATLMTMTTSHRAIIGVGVADVCLLALYVGRRGTQRAPLRWPRRGEALCLLGLVGLLLAAAHRAQKLVPQVSAADVAAAALVLAAVAALLMQRRARALGLLAAYSMYLTGEVNPTVRGGTAYLFHNALSEKILELRDETAGAATWVVAGSSEVADLLRVLGVKSMSGLFMYPQLTLWRQLDPAGKFTSTYNRYAHAEFRFGAAAEPTFELLGPDRFVVTVAPDEPLMAQAGVDFYIVEDTGGVMAGSRRFGQVFSYAGHTIYRRLPPAAAGP